MHENENMPPQGDASYDYYPLEADGGDALLPEGQEVVMHRASGHVALIDWELRMVKAEAMFDERECLFLRILLQHKRKVEEQENILGEDYKNVFQKQNFANKAHFRGLCGFSHRYYHVIYSNVRSV